MGEHFQIGCISASQNLSPRHTDSALVVAVHCRWAPVMSTCGWRVVKEEGLQHLHKQDRPNKVDGIAEVKAVDALEVLLGRM